jgi:hypothetical protein
MPVCFLVTAVALTMPYCPAAAAAVVTAGPLSIASVIMPGCPLETAVALTIPCCPTAAAAATAGPLSTPGSWLEAVR